MALRGNLRDFSIVQLLNLINLASKTGTLRVESDVEQANLSFRGGKLVHATLDGPGRELVSALRHGGLITDEQARVIRDRAGSRSDKELGLLLMNAGYVSQKDILEIMQLRVLDNVYPLFRWSEGLFYFESGEPHIDGVITVRVDLENVIIQGTRQMEEWERLQEELPDLDGSLRIADRPQTSLRDINLNAQEWRVISFINPRNTIRQIAQYNSMSDFRIRKIVYGLLQAGLVEIVRPEPTEVDTGAESGTVPEKKRRPGVKRNVIMRLIDRIREL